MPLLTEAYGEMNGFASVKVDELFMISGGEGPNYLAVAIGGASGAVVVASGTDQTEALIKSQFSTFKQLSYHKIPPLKNRSALRNKGAYEFKHRVVKLRLYWA